MYTDEFKEISIGTIRDLKSFKLILPFNFFRCPTGIIHVKFRISSFYTYCIKYQNTCFHLKVKLNIIQIK